MQLPNAGGAVVDISKLRDYSLNSRHEAGKHKARVFKSALGLTADDVEWLREVILSAAQTGEAVARPDFPFGANFVVDVLMSGKGARPSCERRG